MRDTDDPGPNLAKEARALYQKRCDQQRQGQADWWGSFDVELNTEQHEVRLVCLRCTAKLGASNPSRAAKDHLKSRACIKAAAVSAAAVAAVQAAADVLVVVLLQRRRCRWLAAASATAEVSV